MHSLSPSFGYCLDTGSHPGPRRRLCGHQHPSVRDARLFGLVSFTCFTARLSGALLPSLSLPPSLAASSHAPTRRRSLLHHMHTPQFRRPPVLAPHFVPLLGMLVLPLFQGLCSTTSSSSSTFFPYLLLLRVCPSLPTHRHRVAIRPCSPSSSLSDLLSIRMNETSLPTFISRVIFSSALLRSSTPRSNFNLTSAPISSAFQHAFTIVRDTDAISDAIP